MAGEFDWEAMWAPEDGDYIVVARGACAWPIPVKRPPDEKKEPAPAPKPPVEAS